MTGTRTQYPVRRDLGQCCLNTHPLAACILQHDRKQMSKKDIMMSTPPGRCAGKSILEHYEDELDEVIEALMDGESDEEQMQFLKGKASGLTWAIALIGNPYYPNEAAVKNAAMVRYEERHEDDEEEAADESVPAEA